MITKAFLRGVGDYDIRVRNNFWSVSAWKIRNIFFYKVMKSTPKAFIFNLQLLENFRLFLMFKFAFRCSLFTFAGGLLFLGFHSITMLSLKFSSRLRFYVDVLTKKAEGEKKNNNIEFEKLKNSSSWMRNWKTGLGVNFKKRSWVLEIKIDWKLLRKAFKVFIRKKIEIKFCWFFKTNFEDFNRFS